MDDPYLLAGQAADAVRGRFGIDGIDLALVLGSGWAQASEGLGEPIDECPLEELPGFAAPVVAGHGGALRLVRTASGSLAAVFTGRTHYYEGRGVAAVCHGVRTAAAAGASTLVLTNGCGGIGHRPGAPVLIADHINLTGASALVGPRFVDVTEVYSRRLRELAKQVDPSLEEGVYCQFHGPAYETPAEVRMAKAIGGTLVGMSTALEAVAARELGLEVLGISLVTNAAAGMASEPLSHAEVVEAGRAAQPRLRALLAGLMERL
ncbi:MAG: purine-nucleoside phosphorylase [Micropruina sp.]|uniref:purine-nucleoside phosphorylase n=1 Tax=Micropruina sp. TaxID=2737536 RepID=UPI0039E444AA